MFKGFNKSGWWGSLVLVTAGIAASLYLTQKHYVILKMGYVGQSLCNLSPYLNCNAVLMSPFSHIGSIPIAGLGLLFYLYLLGALVYSRMAPEKAGETLALPYLLSIFSFLFSVLLAYLSFFYIQSLCIFCASLYLISLLLLIFLKKTMGLTTMEWFQSLRKISWPKSLGYLLVVFSVGTIILHTNQRQFAKEIPEETLQQYLVNFLKMVPKDIQTAGRPYWGVADAPVVIVEFSDFECPYCKTAAFSLKPMLHPYRDQVKLVFINFPLDSACNPIMDKKLHRRACEVAAAAHCADRQGKFWEFHDKAFNRQPKFQPASLENIAEKLHLDMKAFRSCMKDPATKEFIAKDVEQGNLAGVRGTPTLFVNGRPFQVWQFKKAWERLFETLAQTKPSDLETQP